MILGVGDNKGFVEEKVTESSAKNSSDEILGVQKFNDYQMSSEILRPTTSHVSKEFKSFSETYESRETEVKRLGESKCDYVRLEAAPMQRAYSQLKWFPEKLAMTSATTSKNVTSQGAVKSYTNLGYSQAGQNGDLMSNVQFQQPVAVIRAFVNPGLNTSLKQAKSLPRNYSKLNYKKSFTTSTTRRLKPLLYTWSLKANDSETAQAWVNLPVIYKETHPCGDRRRKV
ncbi:Hypothetical predicted protein [Paramuricea clavata]|uniref:Uncharacterized protein n=1 Tax=Paramuricea clavata TaxID=317549 RepID=A0A6S7IEQ3_PARCT|nr:Hypothetical predicted protein [Paramuricea clavata]